MWTVQCVNNMVVFRHFTFSYHHEKWPSSKTTIIHSNSSYLNCTLWVAKECWVAKLFCEMRIFLGTVQHLIIRLIILKRICPFSTALIEAIQDIDQSRYNLRQRELRIAWMPKSTRLGGKSALFNMVKTYNQCNIANIKLNSTKTSCNNQIKQIV